MTAPSGPAGQKWPAEILTPAEVATLIGACSAKSRTGIRNRALLKLLYKSGLRISEAIGYPGRDETQYTAKDGAVKIQPARPSIPPLLLDSIDFRRHSVRVLETKSDEAQTRGFHPSIDDALYRWIDVRKSIGFNGRQPFFCTLKGGPLREQYVRALLGRLKDKAGLERRVYPHGLRHTYACELLFRGVDVVTISKLMGHSSVAVTQRYLDHLTNDQAIAKLVEVDWPDLED
jgi:site-specific recombinase XerD